MTPLTEYRELVTRFWKMIDSVVLLVLSFALLIVAAVALFCIVGITCFRTWRGGLDRIAAKVTAPKEVTT